MSGLTTYRRRLLAHRTAEVRAALDRLDAAHDQSAKDEELTLLWLWAASSRLAETSDRYSTWLGKQAAP